MENHPDDDAHRQEAQSSPRAERASKSSIETTGDFSLEQRDHSSKRRMGVYSETTTGTSMHNGASRTSRQLNARGTPAVLVPTAIEEPIGIELQRKRPRPIQQGLVTEQERMGTVRQRSEAPSDTGQALALLEALQQYQSVFSQGVASSAPTGMGDFHRQFVANFTPSTGTHATQIRFPQSSVPIHTLPSWPSPNPVISLVQSLLQQAFPFGMPSHLLHELLLSIDRIQSQAQSQRTQAASAYTSMSSPVSPSPLELLLKRLSGVQEEGQEQQAVDTQSRGGPLAASFQGIIPSVKEQDILTALVSSILCGQSNQPQQTTQPFYPLPQPTQQWDRSPFSETQSRNSVPSRTSISKESSPSLSPGTSLALPSDTDQLSRYQVNIRQQLEIFEAGPKDVESSTQGRKKAVVLGQVGLRCRHCASANPRERGRGSVYYPTKLSSVYQAAQNMASSHLAESCTMIPDELKKEICRLRDEKSPLGGQSNTGKCYWADGMKWLGLTVRGMKPCSHVVQEMNINAFLLDANICPPANKTQFPPWALYREPPVTTW